MTSHSEHGMSKAGGAGGWRAMPGAAWAACRAAGAAASGLCRLIRAYNDLGHLTGPQLRAIAEAPGELARVLDGRARRPRTRHGAPRQD